MEHSTPATKGTYPDLKHNPLYISGSPFGRLGPSGDTGTPNGPIVPNHEKPAFQAFVVPCDIDGTQNPRDQRDIPTLDT